MTPPNASSAHTCTTDPQQPCEPCMAAYLRIKDAVATEGPYRSEAPAVASELSGRILLLDPDTFRPLFGMTTREARGLVRAIQAEMRDLRNG